MDRGICCSEYCCTNKVVRSTLHKSVFISYRHVKLVTFQKTLPFHFSPTNDFHPSCLNKPAYMLSDSLPTKRVGSIPSHVR